jgi:hypothetical protein
MIQILDLLNNEIVFYTLFTEFTGVIISSWWTKSLKSDVTGTAQTIINPTKDSVSKEVLIYPVTDSTVTPGTFTSALNQTEQIQNHVDQATQTLPSLDGLFVPISEIGIQAVSETSDIGVQVNPAISIDTSDSALEVVSIFRRIDLSDLGSVFISTPSGAVQAVPEVNSVGVQTLISNLSEGSQIMINSDFMIKSRFNRIWFIFHY